MNSRRFHRKLDSRLNANLHTKLKVQLSWLLTPTGLGVGLAMGMLVLLHQNFQLFAAVSAGAITMLSAYAYQQSSIKWHSSWRKWRQKLIAFWHTPERPLVVAVAVGGLTTIIVQMVIAIWTETPNHWLALALTTQLLAILSILTLLLRQQVQSQATRDPQQEMLDQIMDMLMSEKAGDRFIALRQLNQHFHQSSANGLCLPTCQRKALIDLCQTAMQEETIPSLRQAAQQTMQFLQ